MFCSTLRLRAQSLMSLSTMLKRLRKDITLWHHISSHTGATCSKSCILCSVSSRTNYLRCLRCTCEYSLKDADTSICWWFKDLIWSGACIVQNNNTFDFRLAMIENKSYLSWIRQSHSRRAPTLILASFLISVIKIGHASRPTIPRCDWTFMNSIISKMDGKCW